MITASTRKGSLISGRWAMAFCLPIVLMVLSFGGAEAGRAGAAAPTSAPDFRSFSVWIDSGEDKLAAWQVAVLDEGGVSQLVGIEGGESAAFAEPAHYDPKALMGDRVVLAAYSLDIELPRGRTRVATLHLRVPEGQQPQLFVSLEAAANSEGVELQADVQIHEES